MASIRDLNHKIGSLQNMQKVMRAMNMIASTKFSKLLTKQIALLKFTEALEDVRNSLFLRISQSSSPIVTGKVDSKRVHIILFTADRGLCGSHNNSISKGLEKLVAKLGVDVDDFDVTSVGSRGAKYCRKREYNIYHTVDINEKTLQDGNLLRISQTLLKRFNNSEIGSAYIVYNKFISALTQDTTVEKVLPIQIDKEFLANNNQEVTSDVSDLELAEHAAPMLIFYQLKTALSNSYLSEHGARMTAMENASNNSQDLIERYGAIKNRARQTAITNELTEIVSGTEAMK
jgi:F-type H+-transporting ATPase subunit gamma